MLGFRHLPTMVEPGISKLWPHVWRSWITDRWLKQGGLVMRMGVQGTLHVSSTVAQIRVESGYIWPNLEFSESLSWNSAVKFSCLRVRLFSEPETDLREPGHQALLFFLTLPWCAFLQLTLDQLSFDPYLSLVLLLTSVF